MDSEARPPLTPIPRACPHCGADDAADTGLGRAPWIVGRCRACGFAYLTAAAAYSDLAESWAWEKSFEIEAKRRKTDQPVIQWLDSKTRWRLHIFPRPHTHAFMARLIPGGAVVDLGCGDGQGAAALPPRFTPYGVEISKALAAAAHARFAPRGGRCVNAPSVDGLGAFAHASVDGVMLNSYLEHETDPVPVLAAIRRVLKPSGAAVVKVPNFGSWNARVMGRKWCGIRLPDHVNYFTPRTLARMAEGQGFRVAFPRLANLPTNDNFWAFLRPA